MPKFKIGDIIVNKEPKDRRYDRTVIGNSSDGQVVYEYHNPSVGDLLVSFHNENDFVLKPTKKEGWVNVYPGFGSNLNTLGKVYATEADAKINADQGCLATTKIEWEE